MDLTTAVAATGRLWGLNTAGWTVLGAGQTAAVRLPAVGAVMHVSRFGIGSRRVAALQRARVRLADVGIPVVELVTSLSGATWETVDRRVIEVERWVAHDGRMNTWGRLQSGSALLARVHNAWAGLELGTIGEACTWANWIAPVEVVEKCERAARRLSAWGLHELATDIVRLAELTADVVELPTQLVHGDFWDNNIYFRGEQLVAVTDFDFLGRRPRIDDLALLLYFADEQPYFEGSGPRDPDTRRSQLAPLVRAYSETLATPLTIAETEALPVALARQPLWTYGRWLLNDRDHHHARREALDAAPAVARALQIVARPSPWVHAFSL